MPTRVLVIDDSALVRKVLTRELDKHPDITVVGAAPDPYVARDMIAKLRPDVLTLDIEMPRMDGLTFLTKLMSAYPIPTIVVSSITQKGTQTALACLEAGAVEVVAKPSESYSIGDVASRLTELVLNARKMKVLPKRAPVCPSKRPPAALIETTHKVFAIGASTGGTEAVKVVLSALPANAPGVLITQHMPPGFTESFAHRLDQRSEIRVREARDGDIVSPGHAYLAPGGRHLQLARDGARFICRVVDGPRVKRHRPSVDVMFESVAKYAGAAAIGAILTGMGDDGSDGMRAMHDAGAWTIAQNEETCVVFGMPRVAIERGGVDRILPLDEVAPAMLDLAARCARKKSA